MNFKFSKSDRFFIKKNWQMSLGAVKTLIRQVPS